MARRDRSGHIDRGEVSIEDGGTTYRGTWELQGSIIKVHSAEGTKVARLGSGPVEGMARILLHELVREAREREQRVKTATQRVLDKHASTFKKLAE